MLPGKNSISFLKVGAEGLEPLNSVFAIPFGGDFKVSGWFCGAHGWAVLGSIERWSCEVTVRAEVAFTGGSLWGVNISNGYRV